ncbi:MAG: ABC transporter permease [Flavobacteriales bacterium]|nr:ABC transporter permease [Flavobacteriales bacterium]MDG2245329.1 ABC transporter permease [Flavobacteriales bacterium]
MNKVILIIKREYLSRVKKRSFIVMTLLGPILFAGLMIAAVFVTQADSVKHKIMVVDDDGVLTRYDEQRGVYVPTCLDCFPDREDFNYYFSPYYPGDSIVTEGDYTMIVEVLNDVFNMRKVQLLYESVPSITATSRIESDLENAVERAKIMSEESIDYQTYKRMKVDLMINKVNIEKGENSYEQERAGIGSAFSIIIFFFIFLFGAYVMRGIIEEKTSRIVEVIISSVRPFQLMMGKIIGIGFVAITQFLIWVAFSGVIWLIIGGLFESGMLQDSMAMGQEMDAGQANLDFETYIQQQEGFNLLLAINWGVMLTMFVVYFIGGYLLYSALFAAVGAAVDNETDTQQLMTPIMLPLFFSYALAIMSASNPEGFAATFFSFVPFSSPMVMMVRIATDTVAWWEVALSVGILVATCWLMITIAARIYRVGILMYGKRPTYKELWKWLFYKA